MEFRKKLMELTESKDITSKAYDILKKRDNRWKIEYVKQYMETYPYATVQDFYRLDLLDSNDFDNSLEYREVKEKYDDVLRTNDTAFLMASK